MGREQHDVDAFFLDGGRSPQKSSLKYPVTRAVLWSRESPKRCCVGDGGFVRIQLMWRQIGVLGKRLVSGCWCALKAQLLQQEKHLLISRHGTPKIDYFSYHISLSPHLHECGKKGNSVKLFI